MPLVIVFCIGMVYAIAWLKDVLTPPRYNRESMTEEQRMEWFFKEDKKQMDKIMRKYR